MGKSGKKAAAASRSDKVEDERETNKIWLFIVGAVAVAMLVGGIVYWRAGLRRRHERAGAKKKDPDLAELMTPGPLQDISLGKADAPNTIVEYASMTCPHCAQFQKEVLPELKRNISTPAKRG